MELLILFVQRHRDLVTREEIIDKLWGKNVFVDADRSINSAVRKIRWALKDDPSQPKYLETIVGKGYRFIGDLEMAGGSVMPSDLPLSNGQFKTEAVFPRRRNSLVLLALVFSMALVSAAVWAVLRARDSGPPLIRSIAVLPLTNLSGDSSQNYFANGMTEELTTDLGKIRSLKVVSRTSAQRYLGSNKSVPQIARELNVDAIVEGSVFRAGNRIRITTQLIDANHDRHIWAETYERDIGDALAVQNTVAIEIARQVRIRLTSVEQQRLERHGPVRADAYDAYLRGRYSQMAQTVDALKEGLPAFREAINLDPTYAPAYAGLADTYSLLANYGVLAPSVAFPQAIAAAKKSLELDSMLADAHTAAAYPEHHYTWQWAAAERDYKSAISLNPSYATAHLRYAEFLSSVARHDEAIAEMHRALDLDPLSLVYTSNLGRFLYHARRYDEAIEILQKTLGLDPLRVYTRLQLAMSYVEKGMNAEARNEYEKVTETFGQPGPGLVYLYARSGDFASARRIVKALRRGAQDSDWFFIAGAYAALGDKKEAFFCLDEAFEKHDFNLVFLKVHPYMDPLRSDPRFTELIHRIGLDSANH